MLRITLIPNYTIWALKLGILPLNDSLPTVFDMQTISKIISQLSIGLKAQPPDHRWTSKV